MYFWSLESQKSSASNGAWFGFETKKLWTFEDYYAKLNENVAAAPHFATVGHVFGALPGAQIMHMICHFKAWEVRNPDLQTVCDLDLKRRCYDCLKTTMQRWTEMLQPHQILLLLDTFLEHFLELKLCIPYIILKLGKSGIHCFKRCMIWIWNEKVMAVLRQMVQSAKISHLEIQSAKNPFQGAKFFFKVRKCPNVF